MTTGRFRARLMPAVLACGLLAGTLGCQPATWYRQDADRTAYRILHRHQQEALGTDRPFTIEPPADALRRRLLLDQELPHATPASFSSADIEPMPRWPDDAYLNRMGPDEPAPAPEREAIHVSLMDALQIAAANNREYQAEKEAVYLAALTLDLERDAFRHTWAGLIESLYTLDQNQTVVIDAEDGETDEQPVAGLETTSTLNLTRRFKSGMVFTALIGLDLVQLLTQERASTRGWFGDASISIPLLRGSGRFVVTEPLTQAQRNVVYAIYEFERFKRVFAVTIASEYLQVLQQYDQSINAEQSYRRLIASTRRAARLADAGRLPEIQVDQARQDELRARNRWVTAQTAYQGRLDAFKTRLGLPTDARVELIPEELDKLTELMGGWFDLSTEQDEREQAPPADAPIELAEPGDFGAGPLEFPEDESIALAFDHRLDLRVAVGRIDDAQRAVAIAADQLRADLTLLGSVSVGERRTLSSVNQPNADPRFSYARYSALVGLDLPLERTAERNLYRISLIDFERAVRDYQELEDRIKLEVRDNLRDLLEARESLRIQAKSVSVAARRVASTDLFLQAGRAEIRDVLEAEEALLSAQNSLTSALVQYRVAELSLQRDLGVLQVDEKGLWQEFVPEEMTHDGN